MCPHCCQRPMNDFSLMALQQITPGNYLEVTGQQKGHESCDLAANSWPVVHPMEVVAQDLRWVLSTIMRHADAPAQRCLARRNASTTGSVCPDRKRTMPPPEVQT